MVNRRNYHLVKEFLEHQQDTRQLDPRSITRYWFYLKFLLLWTDEIRFNKLAGIRPAFAVFLATTRLDGRAGSLDPDTLKKIIQTAKRFLTWLKMKYPQEFRELAIDWIDELCPPRGVESVDEHVFVTIDEVRQLVASPIPDDDLALQRDRAGAAWLYLSGMRAGAFGTLPIAAVDLRQREVKQWTSFGVETKNDKSATTYLLDIPDLLAVVEKWDTFIRAQLPPTAMWYTPTVSRWGVQALSSERPGENRNIAISKRIHRFFDRAGLPYKSPHKFRHGHAVFGLQHAKTMADYQAVSTNLMHEDIRVTDSIYARLASDEVKQRIAGLTTSATTLPATGNRMTDFVSVLSKEQLSEALMAIAQQLAK
jgi:site-specific recombinase XerC